MSFIESSPGIMCILAFKIKQTEKQLPVKTQAQMFNPCKIICQGFIAGFPPADPVPPHKRIELVFQITTHAGSMKLSGVRALDVDQPAL